MKKASLHDRALVTAILLQAFQHDPHTTWLLEKSRHRSKLEILVNYVFDETIRRGEIYVSDENDAVALWDSEKKETMSLHFLYRNISFLMKIGIRSVVRIVRSERNVHANYARHKKYFHLYMIGVLRESQGKGLASALMNPIIEQMRHLSIPIFLETANPRNVAMYERKGFSTYKIIRHPQTDFHLMSIE